MWKVQFCVASVQGDRTKVLVPWVDNDCTVILISFCMADHDQDFSACGGHSRIQTSEVMLEFCSSFYLYFSVCWQFFVMFCFFFFLALGSAF